MLLVSFIAGIKYPGYTAIGQLIYLIGRFLYSIPYSLRGSNSRGRGAILFNVGLVLNIVLSIK